MTNEKELLSLIAKGDKTAFTTLFENYAGNIYTIAVKFTGSSHLAEETVQEVFLKIWLKREQLEGIRDFKAYLFIVARNYLYRTMRENALKYKKKMSLAATVPLANNNVDARVLGKECDGLLQRAIEQLPGQQKKVYYLVKEIGLKRDDAAQLLHIQPETIKYHLSEAMKNLRTYCLPYFEILLIVMLVFSRGIQ